LSRKANAEVQNLTLKANGRSLAVDKIQIEEEEDSKAAKDAAKRPVGRPK
jgi:hypothetical protein